MYSIISNGEVKGMCDKPNYVKKKNGIWINCTDKDYEAIAIGGVAYEDAYARFIDSGEVAFTNSVNIDDTSNRVDSNDDALMELAEIVNELSEKVEG